MASTLILSRIPNANRLMAYELNASMELSERQSHSELDCSVFLRRKKLRNESELTF